MSTTDQKHKATLRERRELMKRLERAKKAKIDVAEKRVSLAAAELEMSEAIQSVIDYRKSVTGKDTDPEEINELLDEDLAADEADRMAAENSMW